MPARKGGRREGHKGKLREGRNGKRRKEGKARREGRGREGKARKPANADRLSKHNQQTLLEPGRPSLIGHLTVGSFGCSDPKKGTAPELKSRRHPKRFHAESPKPNSMRMQKRTYCYLHPFAYPSGCVTLGIPDCERGSA